MKNWQHPGGKLLALGADKLTDAEKLERMRDVVKNLQSAVSRSQVEIHNLRLKLINHNHVDGKVKEVKDINSYDDSGYGLSGAVSSLSSSNYF